MAIEDYAKLRVVAAVKNTFLEVCLHEDDPEFEAASPRRSKSCGSLPTADNSSSSEDTEELSRSRAASSENSTTDVAPSWFAPSSAIHGPRMPCVVHTVVKKTFVEVKSVMDDEESARRLRRTLSEGDAPWDPCAKKASELLAQEMPCIKEEQQLPQAPQLPAAPCEAVSMPPRAAPKVQIVDAETPVKSRRRRRGRRSGKNTPQKKAERAAQKALQRAQEASAISGSPMRYGLGSLNGLTSEKAQRSLAATRPLKPSSATCSAALPPPRFQPITCVMVPRQIAQDVASPLDAQRKFWSQATPGRCQVGSGYRRSTSQSSCGSSSSSSLDSSSCSEEGTLETELGAHICQGLARQGLPCERA